MSMQEIKVGVLGATGAVGQRFVQLLENHPWFRITALAASERSAGKPYAEAVAWRLDTPIPAATRDMPVARCEPDLDCDLVFSGLDSAVAGPIETAFAASNYAVVSNAKNHRMEDDVPLLVPEVNADHCGIIDYQRKRRGFDRGFIATNPNCSTIGLVMALKPIADRFGVRQVAVTTMQALSGAGYPGIPSLEILDNVLPYIGEEEDKMERETLKLLGRLQGDRISHARMTVSAQCNRVHVRDGHMECVSVVLEHEVDTTDFAEALRNHRGLPQELGLPSAPRCPIIVRDEPDRPQPRMDRDAEDGMAVTVGRIRPCPVLDMKFVVLSHNTIRGAAGTAIMNAELLRTRGYLD